MEGKQGERKFFNTYQSGNATVFVTYWPSGIWGILTDWTAKGSDPTTFPSIEARMIAFSSSIFWRSVLYWNFRFQHQTDLVSTLTCCNFRMGTVGHVVSHLKKKKILSREHGGGHREYWNFLNRTCMWLKKNDGCYHYNDNDQRPQVFVKNPQITRLQRRSCIFLIY